MRTLTIIPWLFAIMSPISKAFSGVGHNRVFVGTPVHQNRRCVKDCMTPISQLCTLTESATVDEAVHMLLELGVSGAPVINERTGELVGVVSTFDFLQQEAGDGALLPIEGSMEDIKAYLSQATKICATRVGDLMTHNPVTMSSDESMRNAAILMANNKLHRLPVVDKGHLVGMVTSSDVMVDMVKVLKSLPPLNEENDTFAP